MIADVDAIHTALVTGIALIIAASIPAWLNYRGQKKSARNIELLKEQILPGNGTKLHEYISENRSTLLDLKEDVADVKAEVKKNRFDLSRHHYMYKHERSLVCEDEDWTTDDQSDGSSEEDLPE
jgi:hypothetical protein